MQVSRHVIVSRLLLTNESIPLCFLSMAVTCICFGPCSTPLTVVHVATASYKGVNGFAGGEDLLSDSSDIDALTNALPKEQIAQVLIEQSYEHLDFVWGMDAHTLIYPSVKRLLDTYSSGHNSYRASASTT